MTENKFVLFRILGYNTADEYKEYLDRLNTGSKADILLTLQSALRHANAENIYTLEEAEALSITLREVTKLLNGE